MAQSGSGFDRVTNRSERHVHSSWGRTRTPKNILSTNRKGINAAGDVLAVDGTTSGLYVTENQRFLVIDIVTWAGSFVVNGLMYAGSTTAKPIKSQPTINATGIWIVDIDGLDKVSFTTGGACTFYAACSTF